MPSQDVYFVIVALSSARFSVRHPVPQRQKVARDRASRAIYITFHRAARANMMHRKLSDADRKTRLVITLELLKSWHVLMLLIYDYVFVFRHVMHLDISDVC